MPEVRLKWRYRSRRTVFWQNHREETITKHRGRGEDKGRDTQGCAWQAKLALRFQIPSQASSHGIVKSPSFILLRKWQKDFRTLLWPFRRKAPWKY